MKSLVDVLAEDPNWNGGWYYDKGGIAGILTEMRVATLKRYGIDEQLAAQVPRQGGARGRDQQARRDLGQGASTATRWSCCAGARCASTPRRTSPKIKAKVLYVLSRTDKLFPPSIAPDVMAKLKAAGVSADYFEIDSDFGHSASGLDAAKWAPRLRAFMATLDKRSQLFTAPAVRPDDMYLRKA